MRNGGADARSLAGGYQVEPDGTHPKMVSLHLNTFRAAIEVFMPPRDAVASSA